MRKLWVIIAVFMGIVGFIFKYIANDLVEGGWASKEEANVVLMGSYIAFGLAGLCILAGLIFRSTKEKTAQIR